MKMKIFSLLILLLLVSGCTNESSDTDGQTDPTPEPTISLESQDELRESHINQILDGLMNYTNSAGNSIDDLGSLPICNNDRAIIGTSGVDLNALLVDTYLENIPQDPEFGSNQDTGYTICVNNNGAINISAPYADSNKLQVLSDQ